MGLPLVMPVPPFSSISEDLLYNILLILQGGYSIILPGQCTEYIANGNTGINQDGNYRILMAADTNKLTT